ncbi:hypothetical protein ACOMHN_053378 [Nucella lapillus]
MDDISHGLEVRPIPCEPNDDANQGPQFPANFRYVRRSVPGPGCSREVFEEQLRGCDCVKDCQPDTCYCLRQFGGPNYHPCSAQLYPHTLSSSRLKPLFECNTQCSCDAACSNRLVQHGPRVKVKIAPAGTRGFGLFACENIQQLSFVCEYAGEVVDPGEALKRLEGQGGGVNYLIVLREHCSSGVVSTCVDPKRMGNVGRFANHSCDPNLLMVPVRVDNSVPKLALFARRDIDAGEELTFDYSGESVLNDVCTSDCQPVTRQKHERDVALGRHCGVEKEGGVTTNECASFTESDCEKCFRDRPTNSGSEASSGDCVSAINPSEIVHSETPTECSQCLNNVNVGDKCEGSNKSAHHIGDASHLTNSRKRKRTQREEETHSHTVKRTCGKEIETGHSADTESSTNHMVLKVCLCGSGHCKGYLPFDRMIFESF